jgi:hypothetical protein
MLGRLLTGRMLQYLLLIVAMLVLNFMLPRMMPGTPLAFLAGEDVGLMTAEQRQAVMEQHGLDKPLPQQFGRYVVNLAQGDFGYSFQQRRPIADIIGERLPWTLLLAGALVGGLHFLQSDAGRRWIVGQSQQQGVTLDYRSLSLEPLAGRVVLEDLRVTMPEPHAHLAESLLEIDRLDATVIAFGHGDVVSHERFLREWPSSTCVMT